MRRRGSPPPWGSNHRSYPPSSPPPPPPPPEYHDRFDHPLPPPSGRVQPRFWDDPRSSGPPPWMRDRFDGPPRRPPWEDNYSSPHCCPPPFRSDGLPLPRGPPPPSFMADGPSRPPPWKSDSPPHCPPSPPFNEDDPLRPPPWKTDSPPHPAPPSSFSDDDFDIPPPPPPLPPPPYLQNGPPRGRGKDGHRRGGIHGRGSLSGRGEAPKRGGMISRGANQVRGAMMRGVNNGRGAPPARAAPRGWGASARGMPTTRGQTRGRPNGSRGVARGSFIYRGGTFVSNSDSKERNDMSGLSDDNGKGLAKWLSAIRNGKVDTDGQTSTAAVGNNNINAATPQKQNFQSTNTDAKTGKGNHFKTQPSVVKAAIPGNPNFISFKNSLQECCQKQQLPVPSYTTWKNSFGYSGKVEVANNTFKSNGVQGERKEAEQGAAYAALIALGLIDASVKFDVKTAAVVKRPAIDNSNVLDSAGKRIKLETTSTLTTSYKSRLNEFCQKFRLSIPSYDTEKVENGKGFLTTVVFNKKVYQSDGPQPTKKQSEQNAAQVVLHMLNQCPPPAPSYQDYMEQCRKLSTGQDQPSESTATEASTTAVTTTINAAVVQPISTSTALNPSVPTDQNNSASTASEILNADSVKPTTSFTSHKNKLQEYCQKSKIELPVYFCHRENGVFTCTVHVAGRSYSSNGCNTKKGSEQTAANVALKALGLV